MFQIEWKPSSPPALTTDEPGCSLYSLSSHADQEAWQGKCSGYQPPYCGLELTPPQCK